jgi:DNA ligase 1
MSGRKGIMLCYPFEEKRLKKWNPPYLVQPKLDGERCRYVPFDGGSFLLSSQENPFFSIPHIKDFLDSLHLNIELDGELYCHGMPFEEIVSRASREVNIHADYKDLEYHVFDIVRPEPQYKRLDLIQVISDTIHQPCPIKFVSIYVCNSLDDIMKRYDQFLDEGYEGIIVREWNGLYVPKRSTSIMKFKPKKQDEYEIVGYTQEVSIHGEPKQSLGAFICQGDDGTTFNVGTGFDKVDREFFWSQADYYIGKTCVVKYQHLTHGNGVPRFPVFVEVK